MSTKPKYHVFIVGTNYVLAALSAAAAIPKILQVPQELGFLQVLGLSAIAVSVLGVVQLAGGALLLWERSRLAGAALAGLAFLISSVALFLGGNTRFGLISLIPLAALLVVVFSTTKKAER